MSNFQYKFFLKNFAINNSSNNKKRVLLKKYIYICIFKTIDQIQILSSKTPFSINLLYQFWLERKHRGIGHSSMNVQRLSAK